MLECFARAQPGRSAASRAATALVSMAFLWAGAGCSPLPPKVPEPRADWKPLARTWFERAEASYQQLDLEQAGIELKSAARVEPQRTEIRLLGARIALAKLEFEEALQQLQGLAGSPARGLRARALWYLGRLPQAADELTGLLQDPKAGDDWARDVARLARDGAGREPFDVRGSLLAVTELPSLPVPAFLLPLELDGEPVWAMLATGSPEVVVHSEPPDPSWVTLRFGGSLEVRDVPALGRDLAPISEETGVEVKVLLGSHLLRKLHATLDFRGGQFVVRSFAPPEPPAMSQVDIAYIRGGGAALSLPLDAEAEEPASGDSTSSPEAVEAPEARALRLLLDSSVAYPLSLDDASVSRLGLPSGSFQPTGDSTVSSGFRRGTIAGLQLGRYRLPPVLAMLGLPAESLSERAGIGLDGVVGAGLLAEFRVTFAEGGRRLWFEGPPAPLPSLLTARSKP